MVRCNISSRQIYRGLLQPDVSFTERASVSCKPISPSDDKKCLTVKFFWLRKESRPPNMNIYETPSLEGRDQGPGYARLWKHETTNPIQSGDKLRIETEDPENLPLPSWELLEMEWFLNRIAAISGAADVEDDYDSDHDDDGLISLDRNKIPICSMRHRTKSSSSSSPPSSYSVRYLPRWASLPIRDSGSRILPLCPISLWSEKTGAGVIPHAVMPACNGTSSLIGFM